MLRLTLLTMFLTFLGIYAWKDWYKALCGLVALIAVVEHPDMPKTMLGIQGFSPWNILLAVIFMAWLKGRKEEKLQWDLPKGITQLLVIYMIFVVIAFVRLMSHENQLAILDYYQAIGSNDKPSFLGTFSEYIINCLKWVFPALMIYDGCRNKERVLWAAGALLIIYVFLGLQIVKWMPLGSINDGEYLKERALKVLSREIGFHRVNLSMMMSGGFWALIAFSMMVKNKKNAKWFFALALMVFLAQALTGGRTGYVTWAGIGFLMAIMRWKKYLAYGPVLVVILFAAVPAARERLMEGFTADSIDSHSSNLETEEPHQDGQPHWYTITSGRSIAWPYVLEKIEERPWVGYGRDSMKTAGVARFMWVQFHESFPHQHNLYLQWIMDNGILGFIPVMWLYLIFFKYSRTLFKDSRCDVYIGVGGIAFALLASLFIAGLGSQTFYPREGSVGMWVAIALMLRVYVQRQRCENHGIEINNENADEMLWKPSTDRPPRKKRKRLKPIDSEQQADINSAS